MNRDNHAFNRPSNTGHLRRPHQGPEPGPEEVLKSERLQVERKVFQFSLRANPRGRFLRITEDVRGRRDAIIIPAPGLVEFARVIEEMARITEPTPAVSSDGPRQP